MTRNLVYLKKPLFCLEAGGAYCKRGKVFGVTTQTQWLQRTQALIGKEGLDKLTKAHVAVFGVGGVGGAAAWALCRSGVGEMTLIDFDVVSVTNLNRQMVATVQNLGRDKIDAAADMLLAINPQLNLHLKKVKAAEENMPELLQGVGFVADCIDDVAAKCALIAYCTQTGLPIVSSMGAGNRLDASAFRVMDIYETSQDGLARAVRSRLRKMQVKALPVVCSLEMPMQVDLEEGGRRIPGSIGFVPPAAGLVLAGEICRRILM